MECSVGFSIFFFVASIFYLSAELHTRPCMHLSTTTVFLALVEFRSKTVLIFVHAALVVFSPLPC